MSIRHWPHPERPREKLLERGAHALSDAELLALLVYVGAKAAELYDRELFAALGVMSGHTLKHLLSALAAAVIVVRLDRRRA